MRLLNYGTRNDKGGYCKPLSRWISSLMFFELKFPGCNVEISFDWSSGHAAHSKDVLVQKLHYRYGGKPSSSVYKVREKFV